MIAGMIGIDAVRRRAREAERLSEKYRAEAQGLFCATYSAVPIPYAQHPELQAAFLRGFQEGKELMRMEAMKTASEAMHATE